MLVPELIARRLQNLDAAKRLRRRDDTLRVSAESAARRRGRPLLDVCSNDYLGLAAATVSRETTAAAGSGASRLVHGTRPQHVALEEALARWLGFEACLLCSSAYAANVAVISALCIQGDLVLSDSLNHASIVDGCRLARAQVKVVPHLDLASLGAAAALECFGTRWGVFETYYSLDADSPDLCGLAAVARQHRMGVVLDETHALGVFGPGGRGLAAEAGAVPDVVVGGFGKAFGLHGGFVASSGAVIDYLWSTARPVVYSTATSPWLAEVALSRLKWIERADDARQRLAENCDVFRDELAAAGVALAPSRHGPIFPILVGSEERAVGVAERLAEQGVLAQAIRPPSVGPGQSRLRLTVKASHRREELEAVARLVGAALRDSP